MKIDKIFLVVFVCLISKSNARSNCSILRLNNSFLKINKDNNNNLIKNNENPLNNNKSLNKNWPVIILVIFPVFGTIGNYLVCYAIIRDQSLQTKTNFYLFSLAISDLAVSLMVAPLAIINNFLGKWIFNSTVCTLWLFLDVLLCTTSIYHLATVSILRFIAIQFPLKNNCIKSKRLTLGIIILLWILSSLVSSGLLFLGFIDSNNVFDKINGCYIRNNTFIVFGSIFSFVIPIFIMVLMFILMARKLRQQIDKLDLRPIGFKTNPTNSSQSETFVALRRHVAGKQSLSNSSTFDISGIGKVSIRNQVSRFPSKLSLKNSSSYDIISSKISINMTHLQQNKYTNTTIRNSKSRLRRSILYRTSFYLMNAGNNENNDPNTKSEIQSETKALQVLVIVLITFIISWLPFTLINLTSVFLKTYNDNIHLVLTCLSYLGYISSSVNPLIYTSFNKKFRKNFTEIMCCKGKITQDNL